MYAASCVAWGCALQHEQKTWPQAVTVFQQALAVLRAAGCSDSSTFAEASEQLLYLQLIGGEFAKNCLPMESFPGVLERRRQRFRQTAAKKPNTANRADEVADYANKAMAEHKQWLEELKQLFHRFASDLVMPAEDGTSCHCTGSKCKFACNRHWHPHSGRAT